MERFAIPPHVAVHVAAYVGEFDPLFVWGNRIEAGFWFAVAVGCLVAAIRATRQRARLTVASIVLVAFGAADLVEVHTGAGGSRSGCWRGKASASALWRDCC